MPSYRVHFVFECYPDTHWGEETEEEVIIEGERSYVDGDACFDSEGEESTISNWEDAVDDLTALWEADSLSEYDYIDHQKGNPFNNDSSEFEDGTGDVNLETTKVEVYSDDSWENLEETLPLI